MLQLMFFSAFFRHFCLSELLYGTPAAVSYFVSYYQVYFADLNSGLCIIRYCCSTTFLICTAVRSILYTGTKYFEVLPGTFFSDFDSELCTAVLVLFFRFNFINKNSAGESESEATDDETRTVAK